MDFNERLRKNMTEKGKKAAEKWAKIHEENRHNFNEEDYQEAEKIAKEFRENRIVE